MRRLALAAAVAAAPFFIAPATAPVAVPVAVASPILAPPFVSHVEWVKWGDLSSLRVFPTPSGRQAAGEVGTHVQAGQAWTEVLTLDPEADRRGMREQFDCHWRLAEFALPGKTSWNLEPWRPEVDATAMVTARCNPGGTEEPF